MLWLSTCYIIRLNNEVLLQVRCDKNKTTFKLISESYPVKE